jgi:hypothetical protein
MVNFGHTMASGGWAAQGTDDWAQSVPAWPANINTDVKRTDPMTYETPLNRSVGPEPTNRNAAGVIEHHHRSRARWKISLAPAFLIAAILAVLLISPRPTHAGHSGNDPFLVLLKGIYQPVTHAPNLGLAGINLNDGSYSVTEIFAVNSAPSVNSRDNGAIGKFYVQFNGSLAVYDLPGGAIVMQFTSADNPAQINDQQGGVYVEQTFELTIIQATGVYSRFAGDHNHMLDRGHILANGAFDENCICIMSLSGTLPLWWSSN